ncbi:MAG: hypothetical protein KU38_09395 [Sulfurovum sp. FS08-3]|nr:MAG: hypothetical protein KU38_09395 [Sulfurovum sp. FS08-3]
MVREIIKPKSEEYILRIPKEYLNQEIEILVLPFSYNKTKPKKDLSKLLDVSVWDTKEEDIKVQNWNIQEF